MGDTFLFSVCLSLSVFPSVFFVVSQDWLAASGRKVALAGHPMEWLTPLGLPVVQPYHKKVREEVRVFILHAYLFYCS